MKKLIPFLGASFCSLTLFSCQNTPTIVPDVAPVKTMDKTKSKVKVKAKKNHPHMLVPPC